jgi:hypothetical protein
VLLIQLARKRELNRLSHDSKHAGDGEMVDEEEFALIKRMHEAKKVYRKGFEGFQHLKVSPDTLPSISRGPSWRGPGTYARQSATEALEQDVGDMRADLYQEFEHWHFGTCFSRFRPRAADTRVRTKALPDGPLQRCCAWRPRPAVTTGRWTSWTRVSSSSSWRCPVS